MGGIPRTHRNFAGFFLDTQDFLQGKIYTQEN